MAGTETNARLAAVRALMRADGVDVLVVRSADRHLNEYVPAADSTRQWITGFTGSVGDALVGLDGAWLVVDGRYTIQARQQTEGTAFEVLDVPLGTRVAAVLEDQVEAVLAGGARRVGYEPARTSVRERERLRARVARGGGELLASEALERARGAVELPDHPARVVEVGRTVAEHVGAAREVLAAKGWAGFLVQGLDDLAYLSNLRGVDLPFQATFRGLGVLLPERLVLAVSGGKVPPEGCVEGLEVVGEGEWERALPKEGVVGYDAARTSAAVYDRLVAAGVEVSAGESPVASRKASKLPRELELMRDAFARADGVVAGVQRWVAGRLAAGERTSEADLAAEVERSFRAAGATGLSFQTICGAGANAAIIHYSTPDPERVLAPEDMVLLDCGAYFEGGYATDLTRTFLAGGVEQVARGTDAQRRMFTLVLKAAIAGLSARVPRGVRGEALDALVRRPLWEAGVDYKHGTGHGVGINVHEAPPRIGMRSGTEVEVGQVFSIEPGLYEEGVGGVRIENLARLVESEEAPGFLEVEPLTWSPLDERLIAWELLDAAERRWVESARGRGARGQGVGGE